MCEYCEKPNKTITRHLIGVSAFVGAGRVFDENLDEPKKEKAYLLEHTTEVINSQERVIHHQKYKRCLAMSEWCNAEIGIADTDSDYKDVQWYQKWYERWLKIAEQFKEDK